MIEITLIAPCNRCRYIQLETIHPAEMYLDVDGHLVQEEPEVRCIHQPVCNRLQDPTDDQLAAFLTDWMIRHPDRMISQHLAVINGEYTPVVEVKHK